MTSVDQSFQKTYTTNKKPSSNPEPLIATNLPSSNTFTISFGDLKSKNKIFQIKDSLGYESASATKIPTIARNMIQAQDHMDKASVLEDASNYIKELQGRVKKLEGLSSPKRKNFQSSVISMKRSKLSTSDDEYYSTDDTNSCDSTNPFKLSPEIEVRMSGSSVLVKIECEKNISSFVKALNQMQKLGLTTISSSAMPFSKTRLLINIVSQIEDGFCITPTDLVKQLQLAI
ncbi:LOW QUALITY PROTEIN: transcription factor bHLH18 [Lactuca sativa]|uniref:LOW QUALITY PROTEIN: transcription factor bHLH18 n=1 Tax=Lactuca sativa TaxID=4236 RepID=UPI0022AF5CFC|nr:LOW QUALITY PROTEIN: transcription factor bHLH18 [Lactuca sativa]